MDAAFRETLSRLGEINECIGDLAESLGHRRRPRPGHADGPLYVDPATGETRTPDAFLAHVRGAARAELLRTGEWRLLPGDQGGEGDQQAGEQSGQAGEVHGATVALAGSAKELAP
jgi:hypothetical protein